MLQLNFANMMKEVIGSSGLSEQVLESCKIKIQEAHDAMASRRHAGLQFLDLPDRDTSDILEMGRQIRGEADFFLLLGIGGSALGPKAIVEALSPFHNLRGSPRVFIYDNTDPETLSSILSLVDLKRTTVNVISKSGGTAETAAAFMILWDRMKAALGEKAAGRFVATTDPVSGTLRKFSEQKGLLTLPIDRGVGGRYSVLSPVGLLTAAVIGADVQGLLAGARDMRQSCSNYDLWQNPAYMFGTCFFLMNTEEKRNINVIIPYSDRLRSLSEWFCQLWSESLGKEGKGMTPYPSIGTTDQHSQLQLWMEGPEDKVIAFVRPEGYSSDFMIPEGFSDIEGINYLSRHMLSELIRSEEESTELALAKKGRPNMTLRLPSVDAYHLGQLFMFFEIATAFTGLLMGIDPFNQPGVEESKNYTYGMMGKKGFTGAVSDIESARAKKVRWTI